MKKIDANLKIGEIVFPFHNSLVAQCLAVTPSPEVQKSLIDAELSFLYSTQYFAEDNAEINELNS